MASGPNRKESPAEPFKRALGLCVRAIAGDEEVQVSSTSRGTMRRRTIQNRSVSMTRASY